MTAGPGSRSGDTAPRESLGSEELETVRVADQLRVLLVDSQDVVHWGFRSVLSHEPWIEQLATAHGPAEARRLARRYRPHVAIIDASLVLDAESHVCEDMRAQSPATRILLTCGGRVQELHARALGADGAVPNTWPARDIVGAARAVALGRTVFDPVSEQVADLLTKRERLVLGLIADGATAREAGVELHLSEHTIKDHLSSLYRKLGARNRAEAIARAQRLGLVV